MVVARRGRWDWTWLGLFLLALAVRLPYLQVARVVQTEGTTYVTLARHLLLSHRYVGILGETELVMVSVFPHGIALLGKILGDTVLAGRILALGCNAALILPLYALARSLFGPRTALWSGLLLALHPYLVAYAPLIRVESPFLCVWLWGIYATWRALRSGPKTSWVIGVPLFFALAYLLKSEGAVYFALSWFLLLLVWLYQGYGRQALAVLFLQGVLFLLLAAPMILWLTRQTGRLTLDTKGIVNYGIAARIASGMDYHRAAYGLEPDGSPAGPLLDRNRLVREGKGPRRPALGRPAYRAGMVRVLLREGRLLLWPLLGRWWILLALWGVLMAWLRGRWAGVLFPLWYLLPACLGVATILFVWTRYLLPVVPLVALWVGYGVDVLVDVVLAALGRPLRSRGYVVAGGALVFLLVLTHPYTRVAWAMLSTVPDVEQQEAGLWLRQFDPRSDKRIMSTTSQVPFYAEGIHVPMPVDDPERIVKYARRRGVHYVVISEVKDRHRPTRVWLDPANAPPGWELIYEGGSRGHRVLVYRREE